MRSKCVLSMLLIMLLLSYTTTTLVSVFLVQGVTAQEPTVTMWVTPPTRIYEKGDTFSITIWLNDTADEFGPYMVKGWALTLNFDNSIINLVSATEGPYLRQGGNPTAWVPVIPGSVPANLACLITSYSSVDGPGELATVTFEVRDNGRTVIDLKDTELRDIDGVPILASAVDGLFYTTYPKARFYYLPSTIAQSVSGISTPFHLERDPFVNEAVTFNATAYMLGASLRGSYDPDTATEIDPTGEITNYVWDFDDGNITSGNYPKITHSFSAANTYRVNLTVTDNEAKSSWYSSFVQSIVRDVGIFSIEITPTVVSPGEIVSIKVNITNYGTISSSEYVNVTLYYNNGVSDTLIPYNITRGLTAWSNIHEIDPISKTKPMLFLSGEPPITLNYTWQTEGLPLGSYIIWANISQVSLGAGEFLRDLYFREMDLNLVNNLLIGGSVTVTEPASIPVALFTFSPLNPSEGELVTFDASSSYDPDGEIVSYEWDFGDGQTGTGVVVTHVYTAAGTYSAILTVTDQDNQYASTSYMILVGEQPSTSIYINPETSSIAVGETFTVEVTVKDVQNLVAYDFFLQWNTTLLEFVGASEGPFLNSSGAYRSIFAVRYPGLPGWPYADKLYVIASLIAPTLHSSATGSGVLARITFRALAAGAGTLDLQDSTLARYDPFTPTEIPHTSEDGYVVVLGGHRPIALFTYSPSEPVIDQTVAFDASASYDPDGTIIEYQLDFGDGSSPVSVVGPFITHTYDGGGVFTVILTVTDNDGLKGSIAKLIMILKLSSAISISVSPVSVKIGGSTTISGVISPERPWTSVMLWRRPQGAEWWDALSSVSTNEYGEYSYDWYPYSLGFYELKASWIGDDRYESCESEVITVLVLLPQPMIMVDPACGSVGTKVEVNGTDFPANHFIYLTFDDQLVGFLYTDEQGNFSAVFSLPLSESGPHKVKAWTISYYPNINILSAEASFTVIDLATLDVNADVGSVFFKQETAEFYVQTTFKGAAVNATSMSAKLRKPDGTEETLTPQLIATGLYRMRYLIAGKGGMTGTYTLVVEADYVSEIVSAHGTTIKTFLVKPTWERELPRMAAFSVASIGLIFAMTWLWRKEKNKPL